ncbi:MAG: glycoside hydrolase family 127 protein [Alphaproteobacteria bacterium]|jgi:hypothetical protein|nr:glycoside hydrolase family 127 protein [Alphaproteobacteria bacterium]
MIDFSSDKPPETSAERIAALRGLVRLEKELGYLDERLSEAELPEPKVEGERYEDEIPDTLDLTDNAQLAINAFTRMLDPAMDYRFFGNASFLHKPPSLQLSPSFECSSKHLESLPLMRLMSGSRFNLDMDNKFMQSRLHLAAGDGFFYSPWSKAAWINNYLGGAPVGDDIVHRSRRPFTSIWEEGRTVLALGMWHQIDGNPLWLELMDKKVQRLAELAVWEGDSCYFARRFYVIDDEAGVKQSNGVKPTGEWSLYPVWIDVQGPVLHHQLTGHGGALKLARGLIRNLLDDETAFDSHGRWLTQHFHTNTGALHAIAHCAIATDDDELLEVARRGYEFGKAAGEPLTGYYPEHLVRNGAEAGPGEKEVDNMHQTCETCEVADMLALGTRLARAGVDEYWEDVERCVRNQFVENQISRTDWIEPLHEQAESLLGMPVGNALAQQLWEDSTDTVERTVGSWAGWALPNDGIHFKLMQCCIGNAGRSMYYAWDSIVTQDSGTLRVNLLLNRASRWADVHSYLPYEGKVVVKVKDAPAVAVRIPSWTDRGQVACDVNGARCDFARDGSYAKVDGLSAGDRLTVTFPMHQQRLYRNIHEGTYELDIRGFTVVGIAPKGTIYPLYERDHMRANTAPMKRVERFVADASPAW